MSFPHCNPFCVPETAFLLALLAMPLETWTRQERAFGLLNKVYARRAKIRGEQPQSVTANIISWP
jgi:hypothetical protein